MARFMVRLCHVALMRAGECNDNNEESIKPTVCLLSEPEASDRLQHSKGKPAKVPQREILREDYDGRTERMTVPGVN
jgi:hypothetical protein